MDVQAVADDLRADVLVLRARRDHARVAVMDARHGVVQVGQVGHAGVHSGLRLVVSAVGMGDGHGAKVLRLLDERHRARQFGGDVRDADESIAAVVELLEALKVRLLQVVGVLRAALLVGEVRAFHMDAAQDGAAFRRFFDEALRVGVRLFEHLIGQGHGRGRKAGHAAGEVELRHLLEALIIAVAEVVAGVAVAMHFDQARDNGRALKINGVLRNVFREDLAELAVHDLKGAGVELEIAGKNACVLIKHRNLLAPSSVWASF